MRMLPLTLGILLSVTPALLSAREVAVTLSGSRSSMLRQNSIAKEEQYSFLRTPAQVRQFVENGYLVPLPGGSDYRVIAGYPYARPVVRAFIERLSADYRAACGERLVVTSLTRPAARQPGNASPLSVHPAGMAVDLRVPANRACLDFMIEDLLRLENEGVLDATREFRPPHFHIAVFPSPYGTYEQARQAEDDVAEALRQIEIAIAERELERVKAEQAAIDAATEAAHVASTPFVVRVVSFFAQIFLPLA